MKILTTSDELKRYRQTLNQSIGFVPTMGNLHEGHLKLIAQSQKENANSIVSIYVNPTQFNNANDFSNYPKTIEADFKKLQDMGVDACFLPDKAALYPDNFEIQVSETTLSGIMEGKHRGNHFTGVLTVVLKLINLTSPDIAYFGEKDYQQYLLIKKMAKALFIKTEIVSCPTVREKGSMLALSSRNNRLSIAQKEKAMHIARLFHTPKCPLSDIKAILDAQHIDIDYIEEHFNRRFIAFYIDDIRLIDNYAL